MFKALRDKISSWFKKPEVKNKKTKKQEKKTIVKTKKENPKVKEKKANIKESKAIIEKAETPIEELKEEITPQKENETPKIGFFARLKQKLTSSILTKEQFDIIFEELEITLLENNTALEAVDKIKSSLSKDLVGISIKKSEIESTILNSLKEAILSLLIEPPNLLENIKKSLEPYVIIFFGINGTGKTTTIAKLANYLKQNKISSILAAGDTFRAASIEQLEAHTSKLQVPIVKQTYGSDPAAVAFDAISYAKKHKIQCVLIDTAGRMYTKSNLLKEMEKIIKVSKPNLKIFVGESITGNDAIEQAKTFNETIGIDGIVLSKADIDEKAGTILSVSHVTNKPIYFLGTGQSYEDLTLFSKKEVLKNLGLE